VCGSYHSSHAATRGSLVQTEPFLPRSTDDGPPTETDRSASTHHRTHGPFSNLRYPTVSAQLPSLRRYTETPARRQAADLSLRSLPAPPPIGQPGTACAVVGVGAYAGGRRLQIRPSHSPAATRRGDHAHLKDSVAVVVRGGRRSHWK
jgi:hypothetical protein